MSQNNGNKGGAIIGIIIVVVFIIIACASCSGGCSSGSKSDIARDPNGFLGYSDDFWEWAMKQ